MSRVEGTYGFTLPTELTLDPVATMQEKLCNLEPRMRSSFVELYEFLTADMAFFRRLCYRENEAFSYDIEVVEAPQTALLTALVNSVVLDSYSETCTAYNDWEYLTFHRGAKRLITVPLISPVGGKRNCWAYTIGYTS
jgi:hypothetical protein